MLLLVLGLLLWSAVHLVQAVTPGARATVVDRIGLNPYKGLVSLLILISIMLMVLGWRSATPTVVYAPAFWAGWVGLVLVYMGIVLMAASNMSTNLRNRVRHPQLTGVIVWALAHLLLNGDSRSLVLFAGLAVWCVLEIIFINRRDGVWIRPGSVSPLKDLWVLIVGAVLFALLGWAHPWLSGVKLAIF